MLRQQVKKRFPSLGRVEAGATLAGTIEMFASTMLISADLHRPGQDYNGLYDALERLPGSLRYQQSCWLVRWSGTAFELRDILGRHIDANDKLMVARIADAAFLDPDLHWKLAANGYPLIAA